MNLLLLSTYEFCFSQTMVYYTYNICILTKLYIKTLAMSLCMSSSYNITIDIYLSLSTLIIVAVRVAIRVQ